METPDRPNNGFPYGGVIAAVALFGILVFVSIPQIAGPGPGAGLRGHALNNARQIHLACTRIALDDSVHPNPKLGWPGEMAGISNVGEFAERLVEYKYLERGDLKAIFSLPDPSVGFLEKKKPIGKPYAGVGPFRSENSLFKIYRVTSNDLGNVILVATKNFTLGKPLDATAVPFGREGAVVLRKSGEAIKISDQQATASGDGSLGFGVGGTSPENPGTEGMPFL